MYRNFQRVLSCKRRVKETNCFQACTRVTEFIVHKPYLLQRLMARLQPNLEAHEGRLERVCRKPIQLVPQEPQVLGQVQQPVHLGCHAGVSRQFLHAIDEVIRVHLKNVDGIVKRILHVKKQTRNA